MLRGFRGWILGRDSRGPGLKANLEWAPSRCVEDFVCEIGNLTTISTSIAPRPISCFDNHDGGQVPLSAAHCDQPLCTAGAYLKTAGLLSHRCNPGTALSIKDTC